jgi:hypothetical protein
MDLISLFFGIAAFVCIVGGLIGFAWLYDARLKRFLRNSWKNTKAFSRAAPLYIAMLGPFFIPVIVTAICLYFG